MNVAGNLALAAGGEISIGALFVWGICTIRRVFHERERDRLRAQAEITLRARPPVRRPELPVPARKELTS